MPNAQEKQIDKGAHLLYKNIGETPNECILRFKNDNPEFTDIPMTYAGRLDPMAEGLLLVLSGEKVRDKDKYLALSKTYIFGILWGFETDTLDLLGVVKKSENIKTPTESEIKKVLKKSVGEFEQSYPIYSSKPVAGVPLFQLAREGRLSEIKIPIHKVKIFDARFVSRKSVFVTDLLKDIENKISLVSGDFRQNNILEKWREIMSRIPLDIFTVDTVEVRVSSGFYVRQFVSDIAKSLGTKAVTFHIKRTNIANFSL